MQAHESIIPIDNMDVVALHCQMYCRFSRSQSLGLFPQKVSSRRLLEISRKATNDSVYNLYRASGLVIQTQL
jgi:hypothetical protein